MPKYSVGSLYNADRTQWPEAMHYDVRAGQHELVSFMRAPTRDEVRDFRQGEAQFELIAHGALVVLAFRFGGQPWSDAPYSWHLTRESERQLPVDGGLDSRALLQVMLVDASTGILRALRAVSWSPDFTRRVHAAIRSQAVQPWSADAYDRELAALYSRFPDTESMVLASRASTKGGA